MATFQEAAQQAYQQAQQFLNNGGYAAEPGEDVSQIVQQFALKNLADQYGAEFVSNNLQQFAPYIPGLNVNAGNQQLSNLITGQQAAVAGQDSPLESALGQVLPYVIGAGGAYIGAGATGLLDGAGGAVAPAGSEGLAGTLAGGTGDATLIGGDAADMLGANAAGGLNVTPTATSLDSAISGASGSLGASGIVPGAVTENATMGLGSGLTVPGVTGTGSLGAIGAVGGAGALGYGALSGDAAGTAAAGGTVAPSTAAAAGAGGAATGAAAGAGAAVGTPLSRILDGTGTTADLLTVLGTAGITGLSLTGDNDQANTIHDIYTDMKAQRKPYLDQSMAWMNDPSSYINGPGQTALQGVLRGLSVHGNPIGSGTSLGIATDAGLRNWQNAVTGFGNLGLAGEDTRAQVGTNAAAATGNMYTDLGRGISAITNPPNNYNSLARALGLT